MPVILLRCVSCGASIEISPDLEHFACASCGAEQFVERRGGTVALSLVRGSASKAGDSGNPVSVEAVDLLGVSDDNDLSLRDRSTKHSLRWVLWAVSVALALLGGLAALYVLAIAPTVRRQHQEAAEAAAIQDVNTIGEAQALYRLKHGSYGDLEDLGRAGLIRRDLASGISLGYRFFTNPVNAPGAAPMYDTTALPISASGARSFGSNETLVLYQANGAVEIKGTPTERTPHNGNPLQ